MKDVSGDFRALAEESGELLQHAHLEGRLGHVLLIRNPALAWPESPGLERNQGSFDRAIHLDLGSGSERFSGLACRTFELPFQEDSFRRVMLWHVIADGEEPELAEALRVLAAGGELLILGAQRHAAAMVNPGRTGVPPGAEPAVPRLQRRQVLRKLKEAGMEIAAVTGSGLPLTRNRPIRRMSPGGILLPLSRLLLVRAQPANPQLPGLIQPEKFSARVVRATEAAVLFVH